jgi:uncharacterized membrane protein
LLIALSCSLASLFVATIAAPRPVHAATVQRGVNVCNQFPQKLFVAFAYQQNGRWMSRGWLGVDSGQCKNVVLPARDLYWRAESDRYRAANGDIVHMEWGDNKKFCVSDASFTFSNADLVCHMRYVPFIADDMELEGSGREKITFTKAGKVETTIKL